MHAQRRFHSAFYTSTYSGLWLVIIHCKSEAFPHRSSSDTETWMALLQLLGSTTSALFQRACKHPIPLVLWPQQFIANICHVKVQIIRAATASFYKRCYHVPSHPVHATLQLFFCFPQANKRKVHSLRQAVPVGSFAQAIWSHSPFAPQQQIHTKASLRYIPRNSSCIKNTPYSFWILFVLICSIDRQAHQQSFD